MARRPAPKAGRRGGAPAERMMLMRRLHAYIGAFIAPSVLFFAITGGLQVFSLHEAHGAYRPPPVIEKLGELHKKQKFALKAKRPAAPTGAKRVEAAQPKTQSASVTGLKALFLLVAVGLTLSTLLGVWLALAYSRNKRLAWALLIAGAVLPVVLTMI